MGSAGVDNVAMGYVGRNGQSEGRAAAEFSTTRWSVVLAAGREGNQDTRDALAALCELYWPPINAYIRRRGFSAADAQDLTQGFFARLLEKNSVSRADPERGRFRSYLIGALKHFLAT